VQANAAERHYRGRDYGSMTGFDEMIKILFLSANPKRTSRLGLDKEVSAIEKKIEYGEYRESFHLEQAWAVAVNDIQRFLLKHKPHIVHFSGHGSPEGEIILEDGSARGAPVTARALGALFTILKDNIRCVVLNACFSRIQAETIIQSIDCVVGMGSTIEDDAAISFTASFYQALAFNRSVFEAFQLGCAQIELDNLGGEEAPQLLVKPGVDPRAIFIAGSADSLCATKRLANEIRHTKGSHGVTERDEGELAVLTLGIPPAAFDETNQRLFRYKVAGFLAIPLEDVRILWIEEGPLAVTVALPAGDVGRLWLAYKGGSIELAKSLAPFAVFDLHTEVSSDSIPVPSASDKDGKDLVPSESAVRSSGNPTPERAEYQRKVRTQVFVSYSHADRKWLERLRINLRPLERSQKITVWDDSKIAAGAVWRSEIRQAMDSAKVAVLLVSPDFLASDLIVSNELPSLLDTAANDGLTIFWIAVRPSVYQQTALERYRAANDPAKPLATMTPANRDKELVKICERILAAASSTGGRI
jgi:hypothetical protein